MKNCDAVFIIGSAMPWFEYYPKPGQARGVQIDMKPDRIGLRYPVEIGLVGDAKAIPSRGAKPYGGLESLAGGNRDHLACASAAADGD
jgi:thiamine pyrophosphate-dependent acetolactate synthase large subunit-like protein